MKELTQHLKENIKVEAAKEQQKEVQHILVGRIKPKAGHKIFEVNTITGQIQLAKFRANSVSFTLAAKGDYSELKDLLINENCIYIPALNKQNAEKKYSKNKNQSFYYEKEAPCSLSEITFSEPKEQNIGFI